MLHALETTAPAVQTDLFAIDPVQPGVPPDAAEVPDGFGDVWSEVMAIHPDWAQGMLENVYDQRPLHLPLVEDYARQMGAGAWKVNGEAVIVSATGRLLDGRKRLAACARAGVAFTALVVFNVPDDAASTIDQRRKRRLADILSIEKKKSHTLLSSALRQLDRMRKGTWGRSGAKTKDLLGLLEANPELEHSVALASQLGFAPGKPVLAAMHYLFSRLDRPTADALFEAMAAPRAHLEETIPGLLANRLRHMKDEPECTLQGIAAVCIKAWNALRAGQRLKAIYWRQKGKAKEAFPTIADWPADLVISGAAPAPADPGAAAAEASALRADFRFITPEIAADLLTRNDRNRKESKSATSKYARDMAARTWRFNGETIKIGASGRLVDGQHRLNACVKSGVGFWTIVVYGVDETNFDTIDLGDARDYASVLANRGVKNASRVAAAARTMWLLNNNAFGKGGCKTPTVAELDAVVALHPELEEEATLAGRLYTAGLLPTSVGLTAFHLMARVDKEAAQDFFRKLETGVGIQSESEPVHQLRKKLQWAGAKRSMGNERIVDRLAWTIKCWNATRLGKPMAHQPKFDATREALPEIL